MDRLREHMGTMDVSRTTFQELAKRVIVYKHALTANELEALGQCRSELMRRLGLGFAGTSVVSYYLLGTRAMPIRINRFLRAAAAGLLAMPVGLNYAAGAHLNCLQGVLTIPDSKLAGEARCILQELFPENAHARALQQAAEARLVNNTNSSSSDSGWAIDTGGGNAMHDGSNIKRIVPPRDAALLQSGHTLEGLLKEKLKAREEQARARGGDGDLEDRRAGLSEQLQQHAEQQQGGKEYVVNKEVLDGLLRERMMAERQRRQDSQASASAPDDFFGLSSEDSASGSSVDESAYDGEGEGGEGATSRRDRWRRRHRHRERPPPAQTPADDPEMT